ncbi:MAG: hypothetical protein DI603_04140 [Roseateles depolymerans]|uniref:Uncharacterized protein n=1 Tax=Roseateles depolymerans TaxID=76731 RepID=A0A2W5E236_9BURK|nr:MAG: hypothetical protein DI603_04140 [Roseateles depolymerans]
MPAAAAADCRATPHLPAGLHAEGARLLGALLCRQADGGEALLAASLTTQGTPATPDERSRLVLERFDRDPADPRWRRSQTAQDFAGPLASLELLRVAAEPLPGGRWAFLAHYRISRDGLDPDQRKLLVLLPDGKAALRGLEPKEDEALPSRNEDERFRQLAPAVRERALALWQEAER